MKAGVPWSSSERDFGGLWHKGLAIGNAVPVGLAQKVGEHFRGILDQALGER